MTAYYNEFDPYAAQWLRNLIAAGHIADGVVDERSIEDVRPSDLKGFTQCHFFAGIGVWSYALRNAGLSDDRPVWTGSCPCQPFSSAGAGAGFADERHLWPAFFHLIQECKPAVVFGEQVASKDANPWIDLVQTDLEAVGYGVGAVAFPAAGVGAPHIRDRLYWVADTSNERLVRFDALLQRGEPGRQPQDCVEVTGDCEVIGLADTESERERADQYRRDRILRVELARPEPRSDGCNDGATTQGLADTQHDGCCGSQSHSPKSCSDREDFRLFDGGHLALAGQLTTGPTNGFWRSADWLLCRDGKWRPVEPGTFPLVNGAASRVGRLRAYGNAICASQAQIFIEAAMSHQP